MPQTALAKRRGQNQTSWPTFIRRPQEWIQALVSETSLTSEYVRVHPSVTLKNKLQDTLDNNEKLSNI